MTKAFKSIYRVAQALAQSARIDSNLGNLGKFTPLVPNRRPAGPREPALPPRPLLLTAPTRSSSLPPRVDVSQFRETFAEAFRNPRLSAPPMPTGQAAGPTARSKMSVRDLGRTLAQREAAANPRPLPRSLNAPSLAPSGARPSSIARPLQPDKPIYEQMHIGEVPDDGNCFFHSLRAVAGPELALVTGMPQDALTPQILRRHMAAHLIDLYEEFNAAKNEREREAVLERHPVLHSLNILGDTILGTTEVQRAVNLGDARQSEDFASAVGDGLLLRCFDLTPEQQTHVLNLASDKVWKTETNDNMMMLAAPAFGLRLSDIDKTTTPRNESIYGSGDAEVKRLHFDLGRRHYEPVFEI